MDDQLSLQINKLGHEIEEIRVRALTTIISKLDIGVVTEKDLIDHSGIFIKLIDWFRFPTVPCKADVLHLIHRLAKEKDGAFYLEAVDPGCSGLAKRVGLEFLPEVRRIQSLLDEVRPSFPQPFPSSASLSSLSLARSRNEREQLDPELSDALITSSLCTTSSRGSEWEYEEIYLPAPQLDETDEKVLSNATELLSAEPSEAARGADFIATVLLRDFPPQIFLSRTPLLDMLLRLERGGGEGRRAAISAFTQLTLALHRQLSLLSSPLTYKTMCDASGEDSGCLAISEWSSPPSLNEQLGVGELCCLCLERLGREVPSALTLLRRCIRDPTQFWLSSSGSFIKAAITSHLLSVTSLIILSRSERSGRLKETELQAWLVKVLDCLVPVELATTVLPEEVQRLFLSSVFSPNLALLLPSIHSVFLRYVSVFQYLGEEELRRVESVRTVEESLRASATLLRSAGLSSSAPALSLSPSEELSLFSLSLASLDIHLSLQLISYFFSILTSKCLEKSDEELSERLLLSLLSHEVEEVKAAAYRDLAGLATEAVGPPAAASASTALFEKVSFLFTTSVFKEILTSGISSSSRQVVEYSETVLSLTVKGKAVLTDSQWVGLLTSLGPVMPLLSALSSLLSPLGKSLLRMFDPDVSTQLNIHNLQVMTGNVRLLFSREDKVAQEGWTRLCYLLTLPPGPVPRLRPSIPPLLVSSSITLFTEESVDRLVEALRNTVDSKMLKSAVVQLSLLSEQVSLHSRLVDSGALSLLRHILTLHLENITGDTVEIYSSIVVIFKNLALHDSQLRADFSGDFDLYHLILKGLKTGEIDERGESEKSAGQLLALLAFGDQLVLSQPQTESDRLYISAPPLLISRLALPFPLVHSSHQPLYPIPSYKGLVTEREETRRYLGAVWCSTLAGGVSELYEADRAQATPSPPPSLLLPPKSAFLLLPSSIADSLTDLRAASCHQAASQAVLALLRYLPLTSQLSQVERDKVEGLPWEESLKRYLLCVPSSPADHLLLIDILRLLVLILLRVRSKAGWVCKFVDPRGMFGSLLTSAITEEATSYKKESCRACLEVALACLQWRRRTRGGSRRCLSGDDTTAQSLQVDSLVLCLLGLLDASHSAQYYSLGVLERLLACIVEAVTDMGQEEDVPLPPGSDLPLWRLLAPFQPRSPDSFVGLTILQHVLNALNALQTTAKRSGMAVKTRQEASRLSSVLQSRDQLVVASALQLLNSLASTPSSVTTLLSLSPSFYSIPLRLLCDGNQSNIVQEQASFLLSNIIRYSQDKTHVSDALEIKIFERLGRLYGAFEMGRFAGDEEEVAQNKTVRGGTSVRLVTGICCLSTALLLREPASAGVKVSSQAGPFATALARDATQWCQLEWWEEEETAEMLNSLLRLLVHLYLPCSLAPLLADSTLHLVRLITPHTSGGDSGTRKETRDELVASCLELLALVASYTPPALPLLLPHELITLLSQAVRGSHEALLSAALAAIPPLASAISPEGSVELVEGLVSLDRRLADTRPALSSLVASSQSATLAALRCGVIHESIAHLISLQLTLSLAPRHSLKAREGLKEVSREVTLLTNMMGGCQEAKEEGAHLGFADSLHKLWLWVLTDMSLLGMVLRALVTFTASSPQGATSLTLTSTLAGVGQRKSPSSSSLLHAVLLLLGNSVFPQEIKGLVLQLLSHACQAPDSRAVIAKSGFLNEFLSVHSQKRSPTTDEMESLWLDFLLIFTYYSEGQLLIFKEEEVMQGLKECLAGERGKKPRTQALRIFTNLVFNQTIRPHFILTEKQLEMVFEMLREGKMSEEETRSVLGIAWAVSANSHRGKALVRASCVPSLLGPRLPQGLRELGEVLSSLLTA